MTEHIISDSGRIFRRETIEREIEVNNALVDVFTQGVYRLCRRAFKIDNLPVNISADGTGAVLCMGLPQLRLRCPFKLLDSTKLLTPWFSSDVDPVLTLDWTPASTMRLLFVIHANYDAPHNSWTSLHCFLFAEDVANRTLYKLPTGNLHDDCRICTGADHIFRADTLSELFAACLENVRNSMWNADLWRGAEACARMFTWKPVSTGFEQQPCPNNWPALCTKVGVSFAEQIVV